MTKDIMLRISGVQFPDGEENSEEMEVITSGSYFEKDGRHYIKYDEVQEDSNEVIRNLLKIENGSLELTRRGMTNVHMVFEKDKKSESYYDTPFGRFLVGISATHLDVSEKEDSIDVQVNTHWRSTVSILQTAVSASVQIPNKSASISLDMHALESFYFFFFFPLESSAADALSSFDLRRSFSERRTRRLFFCCGASTRPPRTLLISVM